ncbi:hypothetical protein [Paenibacillus agilis]|uniref:Uncharacterized protein n=1 Tax=Paenibacillus agilis TaxID=3020863 RepID=A0A559IE77_9BACL|nr:hypothetical protein [Paenibacillus agilis]TVX85967.1 hypothetical protein FPZ44_23730 [Paenibacillus agilis]
MNTSGCIPKDNPFLAHLDRSCSGCHLLAKQLAELKMIPNVNVNIVINTSSEIDPKEVAKKISKMIADAVKRGGTA